VNAFDTRDPAKPESTPFLGVDHRSTFKGEARTKGTGLIAVRDYALEHHPEAWSQLLRIASPATLMELENGILPNGWYPLESYVELVERLATLAPDPSDAVARGLGAWEVQRDFQGGIYRALLALSTPAMAIRISGALWRMYHRSGQLRAESWGPTTARVHVTNFGASSAIFWTYVRGFTAELARMANAKGAECALLEGGQDGDRFMVAEINWTAG
jgi:hypothetical protein